MTPFDKQPLRPVAQRTLARFNQVFTWIRPCCPHCGSKLWSQVDELTEAGDGTAYASSVYLVCTDEACDATVRPNDTQSTWKPIIDRVLRAINRQYYFQIPN